MDLCAAGGVSQTPRERRRPRSSTNRRVLLEPLDPRASNLHQTPALPALRDASATSGGSREALSTDAELVAFWVLEHDECARFVGHGSQLRGPKTQQSLRLGVQGAGPVFERLYIEMEAVLGDLRLRDPLKGEVRALPCWVFNSIPVAKFVLGLPERPQYRMRAFDVRRRVTEDPRPEHSKGRRFGTVERDLDATRRHGVTLLALVSRSSRSVMVTGSRDVARPSAGGMGEAMKFRGRDVFFRGQLSVSDTARICRRRDRPRSAPLRPSEDALASRRHLLCVAKRPLRRRPHRQRGSQTQRVHDEGETT